MWQYLKYSDKTNKTLYLVKVGSDAKTKPCGLQLVGKNVTNLKIGLNNIRPTTCFFSFFSCFFCLGYVMY